MSGRFSPATRDYPVKTTRGVIASNRGSTLVSKKGWPAAAPARLTEPIDFAFTEDDFCDSAGLTVEAVGSGEERVQVMQRGTDFLPGPGRMTMSLAGGAGISEQPSPAFLLMPVGPIPGVRLGHQGRPRVTGSEVRLRASRVHPRWLVTMLAARVETLGVRPDGWPCVGAEDGPPHQNTVGYWWRKTLKDAGMSGSCSTTFGTSTRAA